MRGLGTPRVPGARQDGSPVLIEETEQVAVGVKAHFGAPRQVDVSPRPRDAEPIDADLLVLCLGLCVHLSEGRKRTLGMHTVTDTTGLALLKCVRLPEDGLLRICNDSCHGHGSSCESHLVPLGLGDRVNDDAIKGDA